MCTLASHPIWWFCQYDGLSLRSADHCVLVSDKASGEAAPVDGETQEVPPEEESSSDSDSDLESDEEQKDSEKVRHVGLVVVDTRWCAVHPCV